MLSNGIKKSFMTTIVSSISQIVFFFAFDLLKIATTYFLQVLL